MDEVADWGIAALHRAIEGLGCTTAVHICYGYGIKANIDWKQTLGGEWRQYERTFPLLVDDRDWDAYRKVFTPDAVLDDTGSGATLKPVNGGIGDPGVSQLGHLRWSIWNWTPRFFVPSAVRSGAPSVPEPCPI